MSTEGEKLEKIKEYFPYAEKYVAKNLKILNYPNLDYPTLHSYVLYDMAREKDPNILKQMEVSMPYYDSRGITLMYENLLQFGTTIPKFINLDTLTDKVLEDISWPYISSDITNIELLLEMKIRSYYTTNEYDITTKIQSIIRDMISKLLEKSSIDISQSNIDELINELNREHITSTFAPDIDLKQYKNIELLSAIEKKSTDINIKNKIRPRIKELIWEKECEEEKYTSISDKNIGDVPVLLEKWNRFCETYDMRLIDNMPENIKKYLICNLSKAKYTGLSFILKNHLSGATANKYDYLTGPIRLTVHYSPEYKKYVYLFGDRHIKTAKCEEGVKNIIHLPDFIYENISKSDKFIDLFVEQYFIDKTADYDPFFSADSYMQDVAKKFLSCRLLDKRTCELPNLRFHYMDVRLYQGNELLKYIENLFDTLIGDDTEKSMKILTEGKEKYPHFFSDPIGSLEKVYFGLKIDKQLKSISDVRIKEKIVDFYNEQMSAYRGLKITDVYENRLNLARDILYIGTHIMDIYVLSRLFRGFKEVKYKNSNEPKYSIIYVGNKHADHYRVFFDTMGFKQVYGSPYNYNEDNVQCLDIRNLEQPLFPVFMD